MAIRLLSDETINKIAAGEVIENPSSVVKELIENAVDAKGDVITVEIERGGFSLIRVSDNGIGMGQQDLLLSMERHATSKIQSAKDLMNILTMGFRGEALASIGAISKMRMITAEKESEHGYELFCRGRKVSLPSPIARSHGTTIEVRSLFYNVPVRLKFQKSPTTSRHAITKLLTGISLAHPDKTFRYFVDGKKIIHFLPEGLKERSLQVIGESFVKGSLRVNFSEKQWKIEGLIGSPTDAKSNRTGQYLFVNGRAVVSPQIACAIDEGYGTRLGVNLYPIYVLYLMLPPEWIDVNVHPQKKEIRLREEKKIKEVIREAVFKAFQGEKKDKRIPKMEWDIHVPLTLRETSDKPVQSFMLDSYEEELPVIGLFDSYLILHNTSLIDLLNENGIYLIDLEGAVERILYDRCLKKEMLPSQNLLFPLTFEFTPYEKEQLLLHMEEIRSMGIQLRLFGETTFIVDALTPDIAEERLQKLLQNLAQVFDGNFVQKEREKNLALSISYSARSSKKGWTLVEAKQTVKALLKTTSPYHCPKGKKTIITLTYETIKKLFQKKSF